MTRMHEDVLARSMIRWLHNNRDFRHHDPAHFKKLLASRIRHMALDEDAAELCFKVYRASLSPPA